MAIIAVAGGTGNVGRAIVEAILSTKKHQVIIFSRKADPTLSAQIGCPIIPVDYTSIPSLTQTLIDNQIHTLISTIAMHSPDGSTPNEIELIRAADISPVTKRLISSGWGIPVLNHPSYLGIPSTHHKLSALSTLHSTTTLEYTIFHTGYFMDYFGLPNYPSYLSRVPLVSWLDIPHAKASIPGKGNTPVHFTHTSDVAKFVAASLDLPKWEKETFIYGDKLTWNQFLTLAEQATGKKFEVVYDDLEKLKRGEPTELPGQKKLYEFIPKEVIQGLSAIFGIWFEEGKVELKPSDGKFLNDLLPEIKTLKVAEMLEVAWRKGQQVEGKE
ncbi:hypothetical protein QBC38DRAFT_483412 [Podospora fimiseda]|uniref:NmrA-like domain-containing protein n=1 Tax=Podospora fimiseda TaxID=252190 RepID=A0AAN7BKN2_9PEZI|nr:hypothetical protein QBC38DRAFT_483412 [Podospora fimiseda]